MSAPSLILLGATGTIGRATLSELRAQGHDVTCLVRQGSGEKLPDGVKFLEVDLGDPDAVARCMDTRGGAAVISCMASRTGRPADAWAVDYQANMNVLNAAQAVGCAHFTLLSAICVQKPLLEFQHAKLAFEAALIASGLQWSIVRPTAFFKSLSGQVRRVQAGKPFLVFGDGTLTACTPISDRDLARYLVGCLNVPARMNRILPIGGPGPALTPRAQGEVLFDLLGKKTRFRQVPVTLMDGIIATLSTLGRVNRGMAEKAEFARIGRYYATESMLVWNPTTARYDADVTPAFGEDSLCAHYQRLLFGKAEAGLGDHAMF